MTQDNVVSSAGQSEILKEIFLFPNGNVVAFDGEGKQVPLIQGNIERIKSILIPAIKMHNPKINDCGSYLSQLLQLTEGTSK